MSTLPDRVTPREGPPDGARQSASLPLDEAVRKLRADPQYRQLVDDTYLGSDLEVSARAFLGSGEFSEVCKLLSISLPNAEVLDLGAGNGIASYALAKSGVRRVIALEPNPSAEVGRGAILRMTRGLPVSVISGRGEEIPLFASSIDVVYARQVLHHSSNPKQILRECWRILKKGGCILSSREHVVDNEAQLREFLGGHPIHQLAGGEGAYPLSRYLDSFKSAGLQLEKTIGPWDSIINAYPAVRAQTELAKYPSRLWTSKFGFLGTLISRLPFMSSLTWRWLNRPVPGRMFSFLAYKV
jgi:2-polyprenyl-3-methyl-5-hydroxy-6-metoxy-1,4-benzoquinol methylase